MRLDNRMKIARVFRLLRKQRGLSQAGLGQDLGLHQTAVSRVEAGVQELTASNLVHCAEILGVSIESFSTGYIDALKPALIRDKIVEGGFRLPEQYAAWRGSKVRAVLPFLHYLENTLGSIEAHFYIESKGIDPDFFVDLDNQININFSLEIADYLVKKGLLSMKEVSRIADPVNQPLYHGLLSHQYDCANDTLGLLESLVSNAQFYDCNFEYQIEEVKSDHVDISTLPNPYVFEGLSRNDEAMNKIICLYHKGYFRSFTSYGKKEKAWVQELQCGFSGAKKCVFRVNTHDRN